MCGGDSNLVRECRVEIVNRWYPPINFKDLAWEVHGSYRPNAAKRGVTTGYSDSESTRLFTLGGNKSVQRTFIARHVIDLPAYD